MKILRASAIATAAALFVSALAPSASALTLSFGADSTSSNTTHTGAAGEAVFVFTDNGSVVDVSVTVSNTTGDVAFGDGATSSTLTGLGFDLVSGTSYVVNSFSGGSALDTLIENANAAPFGTLDFAAADNANFNGGNPNGGLGENDGTDSFFFQLTGMSATAMEQAFAAAFGVTVDAVMRFQQVNAGAGSDKLLYQPPVAPIPVPAGGLLLLTGLAGLGFAARRRRG